MNTADARELLRLTLEKRRLSAELKLVQEDIDEREPNVLVQFIADGMSSLKLKEDGSQYLLYLSTRVYAKSEFLELDKVPSDLHTLQHSKAASLLSELLAADDKEGLATLAAAGIIPIEKTSINIKKG